MAYQGVGTAPDQWQVWNAAWRSKELPEVFSLSSAQPDVWFVNPPDLNGNVAVDAPYFWFEIGSSYSFCIGDTVPTTGSLGNYLCQVGTGSKPYHLGVDLGSHPNPTTAGANQAVHIGTDCTGVSSGTAGPLNTVYIGAGVLSGVHAGAIPSSGIGIGYQALGDKGSPALSNRAGNIVIGWRAAPNIQDGGAFSLQHNVAIGTEAGSESIRGVSPITSSTVQIGTRAGNLRKSFGDTLLLGTEANILVAGTAGDVAINTGAGIPIVVGHRGGGNDRRLVLNFSQSATVENLTTTPLGIVAADTDPSKAFLSLMSDPADVNAHKAKVYMGESAPTHIAEGGSLHIEGNGSESKLWLNVTASGEGTDWVPFTSQQALTLVTTVTGISNASPVTILQEAEHQIVAARTPTTPVEYTLNLPPTPTADDMVTVKDKTNNAATYPINIAGNGKTIDGAASVQITANRGSLTMIYSGTEWLIL